MAYAFCSYNYSDDNYQDFAERLCRGVTLGKISASFIILLFFIGLPWNALVVAIIIKKKLFKRPSIMLMLNLAVINFLVCLLVMPPPIVLGILAEPSLHLADSEAVAEVCLTGVLLALLPAASIYTVAMMSVDRVIYLKQPLQYEEIVTPWRMFFAIVLLWVSCTGISIPPLFGYGVVKYSPDIATCTILASSSSDSSAFRYFILVSAWMTIGTLIQLFGYGSIIYITRKFMLKKLRRTLDSVRGHGQRSSSNLLKNYNKSQLQLVKVFGAIFAASILTVLPLVVVTFTEPTLGNDNRIQYLYPVAFVSLLSKSVIHPILESYMTYETREVISKFFINCKSTNKRKRKQSGANPIVGAEIERESEI